MSTKTKTNNEMSTNKKTTLEERKQNIENSRRLARKIESKAIVYVKSKIPLESCKNWVLPISYMPEEVDDVNDFTSVKYQLFPMQMVPMCPTKAEMREEMLKDPEMLNLYNANRQAFNKKLHNKHMKLHRKITANIRDKDIERQLAEGYSPEIRIAK